MYGDWRRRCRKLFVVALLGAVAGEADAVDAISRREPWTSSQVKGSPDPPLPYVVERAFPNLSFERCLDIAATPNGQRIFVAEQGGRILSFEDRQNITEANLVIDLKKEIPGVRNVYAITPHPDFATNGYLYVCYIKAPNQVDGTHVVRFTVADTDPPTIDAATELPLITWLSGGHNGCCLKFGPDGFLYISTGDAAPPNPPDSNRAGQDVSNLLSAILRIDVNQTEDGKNYRIPDDNPFVDLKNARGEIWAYGFRNPWRMSFDEKTGDLWVGDVGWELWEMLDRVERGGNYGWSIMEGRQLTQPEWPRGPTPILPPTIDHPHSESSSITDGLTYYGTRLPGLNGKHIYGDYDTGKIWSFRWDKGKVVEHQETADTTLRIVGFGTGTDGECYLLDHLAGHLYRLIPNPRRNEESRFPKRLSETGLFSHVASLQPAAGVVPYKINAQRWTDHASADRVVAAPGSTMIETSAGKFKFPVDTVLAKTLSLEMKSGDPASLRRLETQLLHFDGQAWKPYTYRWNEQQDDALLVGRQGVEMELEIEDKSVAGGVRRQTWRFAGRGECQRCHNPWSGPPLAFDVPQLNRSHSEEESISQLDALARLGVLAKAPAKPEQPPLVDPMGRESVERRARSYLHANCAHCHRLHAGSSVLAYLHNDLPLEKTNLIGMRPMQGGFGMLGAEVIAPSDPYRSVLFYRMSKLGGGRMPHIGSTEVDAEGIDLIFDWIESLEPTHADEPIVVSARRLRQQQAELLAKFKVGNNQHALRALLETTSGALVVARELERKRLTPEAANRAIEIAASSNNANLRDLFERFLPPEKRSKRLGGSAAAKTILGVGGNAKRGERLFFTNSAVQCKSCHQIGDRGTAIGPSLTQIGKKLSRSELLESILEPSKKIDSKYLTYLLETKDGRLFSGILMHKNETEVVLKDAQGKQHLISADQVEQLAPQGKSMMPELLLRELTAQQAADLLEFLGTLR